MNLLPVSGCPDQRMAQVAAAQRGRVASRQLIAVGMTRHMVHTRVRRGSLHALHRGVFAVGHPGRVELGEETAALLAYCDGAALSHRSASWLWGFLKTPPEEVELVLPRERTARSRPGIHVHHSRSITPADFTTRHRLPVVRPALALLQLAEQSDDRELELAVDEGLATRIVSRTKLREVVASHGRGRPGARDLAELAEGSRPSSLTRSEAEERLRTMILDACLPTPQMQAPVHGFTADFYWPAAGYAVEFDGYAFHSSRRAWQRDRTKDRTFAAQGIRLDRFTWDDITDRQLATIAQIARRLSESVS